MYLKLQNTQACGPRRAGTMFVGRLVECPHWIYIAYATQVPLGTCNWDCIHPKLRLFFTPVTSFDNGILNYSVLRYCSLIWSTWLLTRFVLFLNVIQWILKLKFVDMYLEIIDQTKNTVVLMLKSQKMEMVWPQTTLRQPEDSITKHLLSWNPQSQQGRGWPKKT